MSRDLITPPYIVVVLQDGRIADVHFDEGQTTVYVIEKQTSGGHPDCERKGFYCDSLTSKSMGALVDRERDAINMCDADQWDVDGYYTEREYDESGTRRVKQVTPGGVE